MFLRLGASILAMACCIANAQADVLFRCPAQLDTLQQEVTDYLRILGVHTDHVLQTVDTRFGELTLALTTPQEDTRTLDFHMRPEFSLTTERVLLPTTGGKMRVVNTVSRKEIMLALLQHGRMTTFKDKACSIEALSDHVGVRQNIVAWA